MTDDVLISELLRVKKGDMKAFEKIYNDLKTPVFTVALRITRDRQLAEDVAQEVFIKIFNSPPDESVKKPRAYIFKITHNTAVDMIRKNPRCEALEDYENSLSDSCDESKADVREALSKLPDEQRRIVALHIDAGLKFREIAKIMGIPLGTALWKYDKAVKALRNYLNGGA